jgi:hypothetical protein
MNFRNILQALSQITEATKETGKGKIHTAEPGGYGRKDDEDSDGKKIKKPAADEKRGRGRPKKDADDTGEVKKYDTKGLQGLLGSKAPSKAAEKLPKKKHKLKDWIENVDKALNEADQYTTAPMPGAVAIKDAAGKVIATAKNPQAADAFKKGDISIAGDEQLDEKAKKPKNPYAIGMAKAMKSSGDKPPLAKKTITKAHEIAKGVQKGARSKVAESVLTDDTGSTLAHICKTFKREVNDFRETGELDSDLYEALYDYYFDDMPYGTKKAKTGDPYEWISTRFEQDMPLDEGSRQDFTTHGMDSKPSRVISAPANPAPTPWKVDPIQATTDRAMDLGSKAGSFIKSLVTPKKTFESKDMQVESWEKELNTLLTEGFTVTSTTGQQGQPDSVSINATDADAQELLAIVRQAGLGVFGGDENTPTSAYGAPVGQADGTGTQPEVSPEIVGDDGDMMALIKKMSGIQSSGPVTGEPEGTMDADYEDEEGEEEHGEEEVTEGQGPSEEERLDHYHDLVAGGMDPDEAEADAYGTDNWFTGDDEVEEGNAFSGAVAKAKSDNIPDKGQKFSVGGKQYPVKEDEVEEGNAFSGAVAKAKSDNTPDAGQKFKFGKKEYPVKEEDEKEDQEAKASATCESCGMTEGKCSCETEAVEESFANSAEDQEMADFKMMLNMGNDLHRIKHDQTVGNPTRVTTETKLMKGSTNLLAQWQKLSGIK